MKKISKQPIIEKNIGTYTEIPVSLYKSVRVHCIQRGISYRTFIINAIKKSLKDDSL